MMKKPKVCLITPGHIASNPRLVKEAQALDRAGYSVHIIFTQYLGYLSSQDRAILNANTNWKYSVLNWEKRGILNRINRVISGVLQLFSAKLAPLFPSPYFCRLVVNRHFFWQAAEAAKVKASVYLAHNLGALPVAALAAKVNKAKLGFDAEDFHRNESTDDHNHPDFKVKSYIEDLYIPHVDHFTAASPLIGEVYKSLYPSVSPLVVLNVFPAVPYDSVSETGTTSLKLFWFSQKVGEGRGIEDIISAMGCCRKAQCELHLLGNVEDQYKKALEAEAVSVGIDPKQLYFYDPVPEKEIFQLAATCDVGMATETGLPYNREICLTNKIFTYIQSGLAVAASDTNAQFQLLKQYPAIGKIYRRSRPETLAQILDFYFENKAELVRCKKNNFRLGQEKFNWETEQEKLVLSLNSLLAHQRSKFLKANLETA